MHEILIWGVIIIIVAAQLLVAYSAWNKIDLLKQIIPEASNFKTVKVYIRESQVKDIKINYILNNLDKFQAPKEEEVFVAEIIDNTHPGFNDFYQEEEVEKEEEVIGYEDLIWVSKGNEEKKIKFKLLTSYQQAGWSKI